MKYSIGGILFESSGSEKENDWQSGRFSGNKFANTE